MKDDRPFLEVGRVHPERHGKRLRAMEIANADSNCIVPAQPRRLTNNTIHCDVGRRDCLEIEVSYTARDKSLLLRELTTIRLQPFLKQLGRIDEALFRSGDRLLEATHLILLLFVRHQQSRSGDGTRKV